MQENRIRNDLTGAERKAFAAEVGRLIAKLSENCQDSFFANGKNESVSNWIDELAKTSNTPTKTIYNWWSAFCKESWLSITPKQAGDEHHSPDLGKPTDSSNAISIPPAICYWICAIEKAGRRWGMSRSWSMGKRS